jgi:hypothetical protein
MPPIAVQSAAPSTLADVIGQVVDAFGEMGDATPIQVGKHYLENFGVGAAKRILFVPDVGGRLGAAAELGSVCSVVHGCRVYVRSTESGDDLERLRDVYALTDKVLSCLSVACTGRLELGAYAESSPTGTDGPGAEVSFAFLYGRDVRHAPARWGLDPATADTSAPVPRPPPGAEGVVDAIEITTVPVEGV